MYPIRIGIADDHPLFRRGLKNFIDQKDVFEVKAEAGSGNELLEKLSRQVIDLVITDVTMPDIGGISLTKTIRRHYPKIKVIGLSKHNDHHTIHQMMEAGAKGYLLKSTNPDEIHAAILQVHEGKSYYCSEISKQLIEQIGKKMTESTAKLLTTRDKAILHLILTEKSDHEIADHLGLSLKWVGLNKKALMEKMEVKTVVGLVKRAIENGME